MLYNLIRGVMAEAAGRHGLLLRESSLKGAQTVAGFRADRETIRVLGEYQGVAAKLARQAQLTGVVLSLGKMHPPRGVERDEIGPTEQCAIREVYNAL